MTTDAVGLAEGAGVARGVGETLPIAITMAQTFSHAPTVAPGWNFATSIADTFTMADTITPGWPRTLSQTQKATPATSFVVTLGPTMEVSLQSETSLAPQVTFVPSVADTMIGTDVLDIAWPKTVEGTAQATGALSSAYALPFPSTLSHTATGSTEMSYRLVLSQTITQSGVLSRFFGADMAGLTTLTDSVVVLPQFSRVMAGVLQSQPVMSNTLILRVELDASLTNVDSLLTGLLFDAQLAGTIQLSVAYISPDGNVTTWAVNSRTGAVTEYENYSFNSFARMGHIYLGASSSGLYELHGDDDAGTSIIARLRSGYGQFAGSRFVGFKAAYLGVRATGDLVFRLINANGDTHNYAVKARDMETVKVQLGKGLRARYFAFELESTGQDFDLESIELVPMVAQRRV